MKFQLRTKWTAQVGRHDRFQMLRFKRKVHSTTIFRNGLLFSSPVHAPVLQYLLFRHLLVPPLSRAPHHRLATAIHLSSHKFLVLIPSLRNSSYRRVNLLCKVKIIICCDSTKSYNMWQKYMHRATSFSWLVTLKDFTQRLKSYNNIVSHYKEYHRKVLASCFHLNCHTKA